MKGEVFEEQNGKWSEARTHNKSRQKFEKGKYWIKYYAKKCQFQIKRNILVWVWTQFKKLISGGSRISRGANLGIIFAENCIKIFKKTGLGVCTPHNPRSATVNIKNFEMKTVT